MSLKLAPDFLIQRRVKINKKYEEADQYKAKMKLIGGATSWFEGKVKYDFADNAKRNKK